MNWAHMAAVLVCVGGCSWWEKPPTKIIVAPDVVPYAQSVQKRALEEKQQLGPPCPRDAVYANCSALHRFILDYGTMRNQARCAKSPRLCKGQ